MLIVSGPAGTFSLALTDESGDAIGSTTVTEVLLNQNLTYSLTSTDPNCSVSCQGNILVEYKLLPIIECPTDLTLSCGALDLLPPPAVTGGGECIDAAFRIFLAEEVRESAPSCDPDFTQFVVRTYIATDDNGNTASCVQNISLRRPDLDNLQLPSGTVTISCSATDQFIFDDNGIPLPWVSTSIDNQSVMNTIGVPFVCSPVGVFTNLGFCNSTGSGTGSGTPFIPNTGATIVTPDGVVLVPGDVPSACNGIVLFNDALIPGDGCRRQVIRTWEVLEWFCGSELVAGPSSQLIEVVDDVAPEFDCPPDFTVTTDDNCGGQVTVPPVSPTDACGNGYRFRISQDLGFIETNGGEVNLQVGTNAVTYEVSDNCGNASSCQVMVTVRDLTEPVAICERTTTVSLNDVGTARVPAAVFDDGSWDECGIGMMQVSLMPVPGDFSNLNFGPYVDFDCADEGLEIMVVYRVFDLGGNFSDCMVMVEVQDETAPQITCPKDFTVDCRETIVLDNLTLAFGEPAITDNCAQMYVAQETVSSDLDQCGNGEVVRSFDIIRNGVTSGITCKQNITVTDMDPFQASDIVWPVDLDLVDSGRCSVVDLAPSNLDPPFGVPTFPTVDDHCALLGVDFNDVVTGQGGCMTITRHWAVIDWCNQTNGTFAIFEIPQDQVITISSTTAPNIILRADPIIFSSNTGDCVNSDVSVSVTAPNVCQDGLVWTYTVRDLGGTVFASGNDNVLTGVFSAGTYNIEWTATTACGLTSSETQGLLVQNTKAPIPVCMNGMPLPLVDGQATLEPSMIDVGSYSTCNNPLQVSFSADVTDVIRTFTCVQQGDLSIELWVTDAVTGVSDFCIAQITVVPDMTCTPSTNMFSVSGEIFTEYYESIENVEVTIANDVPSTHTDAEGNYAFQQMPTAEAYEVLPSKNEGHGNGVNTLDLIHMQRHILGLQRIESPYQLIAADINNSHNVNATDLVELRKLILGIYQEFPENESWRFIDSSHEFMDNTNPWNDEGMESMQIHNMTGDVTADFIGVKIGDVDGTAVSSLNGSVSDFKSQRWPLILELPALTLKSNESVKVPVYASNYENISGWQGTLEFDSGLIEINSIQPMTSGMNELEFNMDQVEKGIITFMFADLETNDYDSDDPLFIIEMKSNREVEISDYLRLGSSLTSTEAYRGYRDVVPLELEFRQDNFENKILAVIPNPWVETTKISVEIGKPGDVKWEFYDNSGRLIHSYNQNYTKGTHYLTLSNTDIPVEGVIFVKLITKDDVFDYKMIKY